MRMIPIGPTGKAHHSQAHTQLAQTNFGSAELDGPGTPDHGMEGFEQNELQVVYSEIVDCGHHKIDELVLF